MSDSNLPTKKEVKKKVYFPKVKEAREAIAARAVEVFEGYLELIQRAKESDKLEIAAEGYQFLIKHMPKDPEGDSMVDPNIDKDVAGQRPQELKPSGPTIQIGIALSPRKELGEAEVIDVTKEGKA